MEKILAENKEQLEGLAQQNRLLLKACANRMSYAFWWRLLGSIRSEEIGNRVLESQEWFVENRLYLQSEVAGAFSLAYHAAHIHKDLLLAGERSSALRENMQTVRRAGEFEINAVELPGLKDGEFEPLVKP